MDKIDKFLNYTLEDPGAIPNIPLYIDQVTSYLEDTFSDLRLDEADKVLTKTMINNYVKAQVIESPVKKKYSKEQMMKLKMLYLLKNTLSLTQIDSLFQDIDDLESLYQEFMICDKEGRDSLRQEQPEALTEAYIFKLLLSSQLQKKYAEMLLDQLKSQNLEAKPPVKKEEKKKKIKDQDQP